MHLLSYFPIIEWIVQWMHGLFIIVSASFFQWMALLAPNWDPFTTPLIWDCVVTKRPSFGMNLGRRLDYSHLIIAATLINADLRSSSTPLI